MKDANAKEFFATIVYRAFLKMAKVYWSLTGGRKEEVFGYNFRFLPSTHYPAYFGLRLPKGSIETTIVRYGDYVQLHSAYAFLMGLSHPPTLVDIGAHHGVYAILLGEIIRQRNGTVIAIEPDPHAFEVLCRNVKMNGLENTVVCENVAVMERAGSFRFSSEGEQSHIAEAEKSRGVSVAATTLATILEKHSIANVDLLLIDVEGAELNVLRGADWKKHTFGMIFCELHPYNWKLFNYTGNDVAAFLTERGYRCFDMYMREHKQFTGEAYIGPTLFVERDV